MLTYIFIMFTALIFLLPAAAFPEPGYRQEAWGSKTWTGPGRPPHWSPVPEQRQARPGKPVDPGWGVRPPKKPGGSGGYWRHSNNRRHSYPYGGSAIIYVQEAQPETIVLEGEQEIEAIFPVQRSISRLQCAGRTMTRTDPQTGELIIEYVSSSRDCP